MGYPHAPKDPTTPSAPTPQAAQELGCRPLQDWCEHRLGNRAASLACYSFADVQRANAAGKCWLLLDGMVLDVGRWLPGMPGRGLVAGWVRARANEHA